MWCLANGVLKFIAAFAINIVSWVGPTVEARWGSAGWSGMAIMAAFACFLHDCRCNAFARNPQAPPSFWPHSASENPPIQLISPRRPPDGLLFSCILMHADCGPWLAERGVVQPQGESPAWQLAAAVLCPFQPKRPPPPHRWLLIYSARNWLPFC